MILSMRLAFSIIVLIAVGLVPRSERAQKQQPPYLTTGAANVQACEKLIYNNEPTAWSGGYCFGVIEGAMTALIYSRSICITGSSLGQGARVVVAFMERHPERLHERLAVLAINAFLEAFPCRGSGREVR
jgi:hypothetical protein